MARRVSPAQYNAMVRTANAQRRRAINDYNSAVRRENARRKRIVDDHNRAVNANRQSINSYNRRVAQHNAKVDAERRRLNAEIRAMDRRVSSESFVVASQSTRALRDAYEMVEVAASSSAWGESSAGVEALASGEAANSAAAVNALNDEVAAEPRGSQESSIADELATISKDLDDRWQGALYALDPRNPDAARHFCTSSREILTAMIDAYAPDPDVLAELPNCSTVSEGRPARRAKVTYLLRHSGLDHESLGDFVDKDVDDVVSLFRVFNDATHGSAGRFDLPTLQALQGRVEGAIAFISTVARPG